MSHVAEKPVRRILRVPVQFDSSAGLVIARSLDIGRDGLTVLCATAMREGQTQRVALSLPSREDRNPLTIEVEARVITSVLAADGFKVALRFVNPRSEAVERLARHLSVA